jgi:glycosyltransferase involved in cell wall biosynthesis
MRVPVLHLCDKFGVAGSSIHGVSRLFSWWFPRYDPDRFEVHLCGLKGPEAASRLLEAQGIPVHHLGRGRFDPRTVPDVVGLARRLGARILHVHGYAASDFGRLAARWAGARLVLHEHFADPAMPAYQGVADRALRSLTDAAIAVSESTRAFLVEERHVPAERVRVIFNGAPLDEFAPSGPAAALEAKRALGIPDDDIAIGSVGRLNAQKGHSYLLEAAAPILARRRDVWLVLVGDGDLEASLREQARALGMGDRTLFVGHRSDIPAVLAALDVFCISSTYEGTPLALFEAMAAGKAIVSTAVDGCREVLDDGNTGLLVPPRDAPALGAGLSRVIEDRELRRRMAEAARRASVAYDIGASVGKMEALYEHLLAGGGS